MINLLYIKFGTTSLYFKHTPMVVILRVNLICWQLNMLSQSVIINNKNICVAWINKFKGALNTLCFVSDVIVQKLHVQKVSHFRLPPKGKSPYHVAIYVPGSKVNNNNNILIWYSATSVSIRGASQHITV